LCALDDTQSDLGLKIMLDAPATQIIDPRQAFETLSYAEMIALSKMFDRWAHHERSLSVEQRAKAASLSSDYAAVARIVGPQWTPVDPGPKVDVMQFAARIELGAEARLGQKECPSESPG
jgi:hypothetical protein